MPNFRIFQLVLLKNSLKAILPIKKEALTSKNSSVNKLGNEILDCAEVILKIDAALFDEAPVNINKGNAIANGVSEELDELRAISTSGKQYLDNMLAREPTYCPNIVFQK